jgi:hypothetical protein
MPRIDVGRLNINSLASNAAEGRAKKDKLPSVLTLLRACLFQGVHSASDKMQYANFRLLPPPWQASPSKLVIWIHLMDAPQLS